MNERNQKIFKILVWISVFIFAIVGVALAIYSNSNPKVTQTEWKQMLSESFGDETLLKIKEDGEYLTGKFAAKTAVYALGDKKIEYLKNSVQEPDYNYLDLALEFDIIKKSDFDKEITLKKAEDIISRTLDLEFSPEYYPEYCDIAYKEAVWETDLWEIIQYDAEQEKIEFVSEEIPETGSLITFTNKYGVKKIRRIISCTTTEQNTNVADLEKIENLSEIADSVSFSGSGDFSYLTGNNEAETEDLNFQNNLMIKNKHSWKRNTLVLSLSAPVLTTENDWYWDKKEGKISKEKGEPVKTCDVSIDFEIKKTNKDKPEGIIKTTINETGSRAALYYEYSTKGEDGEKLKPIVEEKEITINKENEKNDKKEVSIETSGSVGAYITIKGLAVCTSGYIDLKDFSNPDNYVEAYVSADEVVLNSTIKTETEIKQQVGEYQIPIAATGGTVSVTLKFYIVISAEGEVSLCYEVVSPKLGVGYSTEEKLYTINNKKDTNSDIQAKVEISGGIIGEALIEILEIDVINPSLDLRVSGSIETLEIPDGYEKKTEYKNQDCIGLSVRAPILKFSALTGEDTILYKIINHTTNGEINFTFDLIDEENAPIKLTYHIEFEKDSDSTIKKLKYFDGKHEDVCTHIKKIKIEPESIDVNSSVNDRFSPIDELDGAIDSELQEQEDKIIAIITAKIEEIVVRIIDEMFAEACS